MHEGATEFLGLQQAALRNEIGDSDERLREGEQCVEALAYLRGCPGSLRGFEDLELAAPCGFERGVELRRPRIGCEGAGGVVQRLAQVAFLLVGAAVFRSERLQALEDIESGSRLARIAVYDRGQVERFGLVLMYREAGPGIAQRAGQIAGAQALLDCVRSWNLCAQGEPSPMDESRGRK